ncbi:E3 ubiquitin/ISG15 ligase TRIM25-like [Engraulis encrasicolus]|uniref:E3 ubiquitin/ISG15 ligase TRIM25-like n=1 Tax=Engraulis encrasicolus TaxID=184585 RepID=UPI002FD3B9FD
MEEAVGLLEEQDPCRCSICLDPLRDPATIPCGHSYCMKCISGFWDQKGEYSCPQCRETFTTRPVLKKNTTLADLVEKMKKISWSTATSPIPPAPAQCAEVGNVECDFCTETKLKAVKSCLVCLVSLCQTHIEPHNSIPALKNHKLVQASTHLQQKICSQHNKLIEVFCRVDQECICMLCSMDNHKGHDTVSAASERKEKEKQLGETKIQFLERIQKREKELQQIQESVSSYQRSAQEAEQQSEKIFTELLESIERRRSEVKELIRAQQKAAVRDAEDVLEKLEQELAELRRGHAQLEKLSVEEDHVNFLQSFQVLKSSVCKPSPSNNLSPHMSFEDLSKSLSVLKSEVEELCKQHMIMISGEVAGVEIVVPQEPNTREDFLKYFCELTLDPNTAHREISLSEGNKMATRGKAQTCPNHPDRFTEFVQVLCEQGFCRRVYWEVEVELKINSIVKIAVAYKSIKRGGQGYVSQFGNIGKNSWSVVCDVRGCRFWHNGKRNAIAVIPTSRIGVYVDHRAGTLSFYNVSDTMTLLHKVKTSFTEAIYPGFHVGVGTSIKLCSEVEDS